MGSWNSFPGPVELRPQQRVRQSQQGGQAAGKTEMAVFNLIVEETAHEYREAGDTWTSLEVTPHREAPCGGQVRAPDFASFQSGSQGISKRGFDRPPERTSFSCVGQQVRDVPGQPASLPSAPSLGTAASTHLFSLFSQPLSSPPPHRSPQASRPEGSGMASTTGQPKQTLLPSDPRGAWLPAWAATCHFGWAWPLSPHVVQHLYCALVPEPAGWRRPSNDTGCTSQVWPR